MGPLFICKVWMGVVFRRSDLKFLFPTKFCYHSLEWPFKAILMNDIKIRIDSEKEIMIEGYYSYICNFVYALLITPEVRDLVITNCYCFLFIKFNRCNYRSNHQVFMYVKTTFSSPCLTVHKNLFIKAFCQKVS